MTFNNGKTIVKMRIRIFAETILLIAYIIVVYFAEMIRFPIFGISETYLTVSLVCIYFVLVFYPMVLNYQYVMYSDEGDTIVFRYFMTGIVGGKKNSVEINKSSFTGFKTEKKFFGLMHSVTLFQQMREGVANYPPIYISNLTKQEKSKVLNSLLLHSPKEETEVTRQHE
jgi:hypothetical protein